MVVIEIRNHRYDAATRSLVEEPCTRVEVQGTFLRVTEGDPEWVEAIKDIVLDHPETKLDLTFETDPELWAQNLPKAFRTGDTEVTARVQQLARTGSG
jgi:hypothetical protein